MSKKTGIEWTHHTFNPWWGCERVSPGCANCYAADLAARFGTEWGPDVPRRFFGDKHWAGPLAWDREASEAGERRRVFCASMGDVLEERPDLQEPRERLWRLIEATPNLDWLILTKRPENFWRMSPGRWGPTWWPANVWAGTTVENQEQAEKRIPELLRVPTRIRFLSCEPLLGPVDLTRVGKWRDVPLSCLEEQVGHVERSAVSWVICGGESGGRARPMHPGWARALRDQCAKVQVPFFFKQWGEYGEPPPAGASAYDPIVDPKGEGFGGYAIMRRVGKKSSGALLDGVEHKAVPS